ncbi:TetR/AcrR family transcriptional regulator [Rhodococcus sp. NPDC003318]|uniref:TetR/AcrR family transcriptional regulator n=1 Tax=Rhodococcus sp. NPDC003318 TaxID=3364503 RepID=UPI00367A1B94
MARRRAVGVLSVDASVARGQILAAAESTFQRYGVLKSTMDDIAREAGVSRPTLYRYFRDRDALVTALIEVRSRRLFDETREFLTRYETVAEQLVEGLVHLVDLGRKDPLIRLIVGPEHLGWGAPLAGSSELAADLTHEMWSPVIDAARHRGEIRPGATTREITDWIVLVELILVGRMDFGAASDPDLRGFLTRLLLPGIVTDPSAEDPASPFG